MSLSLCYLTNIWFDSSIKVLTFSFPVFSRIQYPVSEAGIIILPHQGDVDEGELMDDIDMLESEPTPLKWPRKPGVPHSELFNPEDSWYDAPPEGFNLTVRFLCPKQGHNHFCFTSFINV